MAPTPTPTTAQDVMTASGPTGEPAGPTARSTTPKMDPEQRIERDKGPVLERFPQFGDIAGVEFGFRRRESVGRLPLSNP